MPDSPTRCVAIRRRVSFQIKRVARNVLSYTRCSNNSWPRAGGYIYLLAFTIFVAREKNFLFLPSFFFFFLLSPSSSRGTLVKKCHYGAVFSTSLLEQIRIYIVYFSSHTFKLAALYLLTSRGRNLKSTNDLLLPSKCNIRIDSNATIRKGRKKERKKGRI